MAISVPQAVLKMCGLSVAHELNTDATPCRQNEYTPHEYTAGRYGKTHKTGLI